MQNQKSGKKRQDSQVIQLFAGTAEAQDPRRQTLIANVLDEIRRLSN